MDQQIDQHEAHLIELTAGIVVAYIGNTPSQADDIPGLIRQVHAAMAEIAAGKQEAAALPPVPAVSIKKSVTPDYIISLEDGRQFKTMKRHLANLDLTPAQYRTKWGLPRDYPMVAPNYAAKRSELARKIGLGRKSSTNETEWQDAAPAAAPAQSEHARAPARRGRPPRKTAAGSDGA